MSAFLNDPMFTGLQRVLDTRFAQHTASAANIANSETPGYRARVVDFDAAIAGAFQEHGEMPADESMPMVELEAPDWAVDGNSVNAEREAARLMENRLMYEAVAEGIGRRLALLKFAANDGR